MMIRLKSFGFKYRKAQTGQLLIDVRHFNNPFYVDALRSLSGLSPQIHQFFQQDASFLELINKSYDLIMVLASNPSPKTLDVAIGCTGGMHRSVYLVEQLANRLQQHYPVEVLHMEQSKW